jgi:SPP1 gp7 family putative phage head morphogenesis protein
MPSASSELINIVTRHAAHFERLKSSEVNTFDEYLVLLDKDIRNLLSKNDITSFTRTRFEKQLQQVRSIIQAVYASYKAARDKSIVDVANYEAEFEQKALGRVVINAQFTLPSENQIMAAVYSNPLTVTGISSGALLNQFFDEILAPQTMRRIEGAIRIGFAQGQTTQQVINRIRGTAKNNFKDGLFALLKRDAEIVTRTALQHVATQSREAVWSKNSDIIKKVRFVATLDSRTSTLCRSIDGKEYPIDKGPRPPFHLQCRTTVTAVLDDRFKILDEGATRAARDESGSVYKVPADQTYYSWLKDQPAQFQDSVIGINRGRLLRNGGLTAERFAELQLNKDFSPATLNEIRKMEPLAFEKAGI